MFFDGNGWVELDLGDLSVFASDEVPPADTAPEDGADTLAVTVIDDAGSVTVPTAAEHPVASLDVNNFGDADLLAALMSPNVLDASRADMAASSPEPVSDFETGIRNAANGFQADADALVAAMAHVAKSDQWARAA